MGAERIDYRLMNGVSRSGAPNRSPNGRPAETEPPLMALDSTRARILRLMADGDKDEVIARRLGISVRTCRRHIADYLDQVGAASRFQAGVIAAERGHLRLIS